MNWNEIINPRRACAARVTVYNRHVCVCLCVCKSHLTLEASLLPENGVKYLADDGGQKICGVFSGSVPLLRSSAPSPLMAIHRVGHFTTENTHVHQVLDNDCSSRCDAPYAIAVRSPCVLALR